MRRMLLALSLLFMTFGAVSPQSYKVRTQPKLPMRDALDRMNLVTAWNTRVPVDGNRDGIFSVQLIPGKTNQLVVQTFKGGVFLYDADHGDLIWKTYIGVPYWTPQPAGFNSQAIFVTRRNVLHVLNRVDGAQRVYTFDDRVKQAEFGYTLSFTPNATLIADEDYLYIPMGDRLNAFFIPDFARIEKIQRARGATQKELKESKDKLPYVGGDDLTENRDGLDSPQPVLVWGYRFGDKFMKTPPLVYGTQLSMLTTDGVLTSIGREEDIRRDEIFEFKVNGATPGAAAQHWNMAYVGSEDFNVYAINMNGGALKWRHVSGAPIRTDVAANDRDVFIYPEGVGLRRLERETGREAWTNRDTQRFLAANPAYVYALDNVGRFFVLDARRGSTLATLSMIDWGIPVPNEWTDRIYLAANDGQLLCLRHRDYTKPLVMKTPVPLAPKEEKKKDEKKDEKKEDKKDEDKKDDKKDEKKDDKEKGAVPSAPCPYELVRGARLEHAILSATRRSADATRDDRRCWAGL